jgi:hypothetical protein
MVDGPSKSSPMTPAIAGKIRQFKRLLMSSSDFKHARLVADYILDGRLHERPESETHVLLPALNCSMVIAYTRPFSGNDARSATKVPDLPARFLSVLDERETLIHNIALKDRMKVLAHSDSDGLEIEPVVADLPGVGPHVVPLSNWGLAPLVRDAVETLRSAAAKLFEAVLYERRKMEPELIPHFRPVEWTRIYDPPP